MNTQVFVASTAFGLATLVAALDDGAFDDGDLGDGALGAAGRRVLVLSHTATVPETAHRIEEVAGVDVLLERFDAVHDYNAAIAPEHPSVWRPRESDLPLLERYFSARWSVTGDVRLVVESLQAGPALSLAQIFADAAIDVYADGLMGYGPTRIALPALVASRIERLLHLDLVPGLAPVLLSEHAVPRRLIPDAAFKRVIAALGPPPEWLHQAPAGQVAVLLGQYLSELDVLTVEEETGLHLEMLRGAVAAGFDQVVFKPHPNAPSTLAEPLVAEGERLGAAVTIEDLPALVETWWTAPAVGLVVGCFSTALTTAAGYGVSVARVGTEVLLERLAPYQNSNRVPVTIVDATVPHLSTLSVQPGPAEADASVGPALVDLVQAVSYCMQPDRYPTLRPVAERLLEQHWSTVERYFKRRRLGRLRLPGGLPPRRGRVSLPVRAVVRRTLGSRLTDRVSQLGARRSGPGRARR